MAHKSLIVCDSCGAEGRAEGAPYPEGWILASIATWTAATEHSPRAKSCTDKDLCPKCAEPIWSALRGGK